MYTSFYIEERGRKTILGKEMNSYLRNENNLVWYIAKWSASDFRLFVKCQKDRYELLHAGMSTISLILFLFFFQ